MAPKLAGCWEADRLSVPCLFPGPQKLREPVCLEEQQTPRLQAGGTRIHCPQHGLETQVTFPRQSVCRDAHDQNKEFYLAMILEMASFQPMGKGVVKTKRRQGCWNVLKSFAHSHPWPQFQKKAVDSWAFVFLSDFQSSEFAPPSQEQNLSRVASQGKRELCQTNSSVCPPALKAWNGNGWYPVSLLGFYYSETRWTQINSLCLVSSCFLLFLLLGHGNKTLSDEFTG